MHVWCANGAGSRAPQASGHEGKCIEWLTLNGNSSTRHQASIAPIGPALQGLEPWAVGGGLDRTLVLCAQRVRLLVKDPCIPGIAVLRSQQQNQDLPLPLPCPSESNLTK